MIARILPLPQQSFFLLGPRGTGKTTWLHANLPGAHFIDLLAEETYQSLLARPQLLADELRILAPGSWVVIDEVQRLPSLLNEVHRLIEARRLKFALCGSSARKLKRAGVNLLAGRALPRAMHPFVPEEIGLEPDMDQLLRFGLLPIVWDAPEKQETLAAYARLYLKEEIQAEALVRNLPGFARFLPVAALYHGQVINVANVSREAGVARTTVTGYLDILEETLLCFRLEAHEARLRVRERKLPKWYWCDPGLVRAIKQASGQVIADEKGALFEGLVAQLLRAYRDYRGLFTRMAFWATTDRSDTEVDFLLLHNGMIAAVEAKSGRQFQDHWCKGLRAIAALKGLARRIVVYPRGPRLQTADGIEVMPFNCFCDLLARGELWPNGAAKAARTTSDGRDWHDKEKK